MLDVLAGRKVGQGVEGVITLNGHVLTRELANRCISYVGQEDVFMPTMSTWESLLFVTQLCMEPALKSVRAARMDAVLEQMGLLKVKHSKVVFSLEYATEWLPELLSFPDLIRPDLTRCKIEFSS